MKKVIWSATALKSYQKIIAFILEHWSPEIALKFERETYNLIEKVARYNKICPASSTEPSFRRCVLTAQTSMVYKVKEELIEIVAFVDNRSDHSF